jgi:hypothetical protein
MSPTEKMTFFPAGSVKGQLKILEQMSGEDRRKFLPMAHKKTLKEFREIPAHPHPTSYREPRTSRQLAGVDLSRMGLADKEA